MVASTSGQEIRQLARCPVRREPLDLCLAAIREFVAYVRANEPGTLRYDVWQEDADRIHSASREVKAFAGVLVAVRTVLGRYRGEDWPGSPSRCPGAPVADE